MGNTKFLAWLFFRENPRYCYTLGVLVFTVMQKSVTFCNIFVITEDNYLKHRVCVHCPKSELYYQGRQFKMFFFPELCSFFHLDILSSIKHLTAEHWHPHVMLLLAVVTNKKMTLLWKIKSSFLHSRQCICPCFAGVGFTSTQHNILSKPQAVYPHSRK